MAFARQVRSASPFSVGCMDRMQRALERKLLSSKRQQNYLLHVRDEFCHDVLVIIEIMHQCHYHSAMAVVALLFKVLV